MREAKPRFSLIKLVILALCICVFVFGTNAKLSLYQPSSSTVRTVGAAKLWIGDHSLEVLSSLELGAAVFSMFLWLRFSLPKPHPIAIVSSNPAPIRPEVRWQVQRFFRPPPAL